MQSMAAKTVSTDKDNTEKKIWATRRWKTRRMKIAFEKKKL